MYTVAVIANKIYSSKQILALKHQLPIYLYNIPVAALIINIYVISMILNDEFMKICGIT